MDEVSKILTSKKKRSKCRHKPPSEICKFSPYASEKSHTSKDADRLNPSETTLGSPCGKIHLLGGEGWTLKDNAPRGKEKFSQPE
jgi:hypothetical protein